MTVTNAAIANLETSVPPILTPLERLLIADLKALRTEAKRLVDELRAPDEEYRLNEADKAMDAVLTLIDAANA